MGIVLIVYICGQEKRLLFFSIFIYFSLCMYLFEFSFLLFETIFFISVTCNIALCIVKIIQMFVCCRIDVVEVATNGEAALKHALRLSD